MGFDKAIRNFSWKLNFVHKVQTHLQKNVCIYRRIQVAGKLYSIIIAPGSEPLGIRITFPIICGNLINNVQPTCQPRTKNLHTNLTWLRVYVDIKIRVCPINSHGRMYRNKCWGASIQGANPFCLDSSLFQRAWRANWDYWTLRKPIQVYHMQFFPLFY